MPVKTIKKSVKSAAANIRKSWTREERATRQQMAEAMQLQLLRALGISPVVAATSR